MPLSAQTSKEKIRLLSSALRAHDAGDLDAAKQNLEQLIRIAPDDPNVRSLLNAVNEDLAKQGKSTVSAPAPSTGPTPPRFVNAPSPSVPQPGAPKDKMALMSAAIEAQNSGDLQTARRKLQEIVNMDPSDANARRMLDDVNRKLGSGSQSGRTTFARSSAPSVPSARPPQPAPINSARSSSPRSQPGATAQLLESQAQKQGGLIRTAQKDIQRAHEQAAAGNIEAALQLLTESQRNLPVNSSTVGIIEDMQVAKIELALQVVEKNKAKADRDTARSLISEYKELFGNTTRYRRLKDKADNVVDSPFNRTAAEVSPEWAKERGNVNELIIKARAQYLNGDYQGAQSTLKEVEARDPDNKTAKALQIHVAKLLDAGGALDREKTRSQMIEEVNRSWQRPQVFRVQPIEDAPSIEVNPILLKLRAIEIPGVSFDGAPLSQVVAQLSDLSVTFDDSSEDEKKKGVNIIPILPSGVDPAVKISLRNLTLEQVLTNVTKSVGFQFDIQDEVVVVQKGGGPGSETLQTEFFPLPRATVIKILGVTDDGGGSSSNSVGNPFASSSSAPSSGSGESRDQKEEKLKEFFQKTGVDFSNTPGADLAYDGSQIIVTQTPRNLDKLLNILQRYNETKQVEIEAKFMEVQQGALEELGVNWNLRFLSNPAAGSHPGPDDSRFRQITTRNSNADMGATGGNLRQLNEQFSVTSVGNQGQIAIQGQNPIAISNTPPTFPDLANLASSAINTASWGAILGSWEADVTIRALEQHTGSDLMTAPRVTVLNGKTAKLNVSQELIYPTSYGDVEAEVGRAASGSVGNSGGTVAITPGTPEDFETQQVGVVLEVTPEVEEDNSITLQLAPEVTQFEGFVEYGGQAVAVTSSTVVQVPTGFFLPIFSKREIQTEVTIFDGATIVLGGLTREEVLSVSDKIPVLGDMPLVGKLFRSEGETRQKRNLLIFVSANLISPGGSPSRQNYRNVRANSLFQNPVIVTPGGTVSRNITEDEVVK